jgi:methionyl-tRNA formyltransferase
MKEASGKAEENLRIVFMGTPDFAVGVLQELVAQKKNIVGVVTAPDRPAGRGRKLRPSAVKEYANSQQLPVLQPVNLKSETFVAELSALKPDLQVVVAFRMLPKIVWQLPPLGTFNLHASLLPQYRGAAPINWAIINREMKTGVTTFFIDEKIDTGAVILQDEIVLSKKETAGSLHDKLMIAGSKLVLMTISAIEKGTVVTSRQPMDGGLKDAPKLIPGNTRINWELPIERIEAFIRGLTPYPGAWTQLQQGTEVMKVNIYDADAEKESHTLESGTMIISKKEVKVAAPGGYISIKEMQLPGKRSMDISSLLNGYRFTEEAKMV